MNNAQHACVSSEWYTPSDIIRRARYVLGSIDLDPASCTAANQIVGASRFFAQGDNGLEQEWTGRVWLNPPSPPKAWWLKLVRSECSGVFIAYSIEALAQSRGWGESMARHIVCIPQRRIQFWTTERHRLLKLARREAWATATVGAPSGPILRDLHGEQWVELEPGTHYRIPADVGVSGNLDRLVPGASPTHASAIVGVRVSHQRFLESFADLGDVVVSL